MGKLKVTQAKGYCTIQDAGRFGYRRYGIPQSGAMDMQALTDGNKLVGNPSSYAGIEISLQGFTVEATAPTVISMTGAITKVAINELPIEMYRAYQLIEGDQLTISSPTQGVYTYLCIRGKLKGQYDFGSISTYVLAGFGGLSGRQLVAGDLLETSGIESHERFHDAKVSSFDSISIRYVKGPEVLKKGSKDLDGVHYEIGKESNRIGIRLTGQPIFSNAKEIISSAVIPGTIQLLPSGLPVVLMNDCQTTGGYPRIGKVIGADMGKLAQLNLGNRFAFKQVSVAEAKRLSLG